MNDNIAQKNMNPSNFQDRLNNYGFNHSCTKVQAKVLNYIKSSV